MKSEALFLIATALAVPLAGCASTAHDHGQQTLADQLSARGYQITKRVDRITRWRVDSWSGIDDQHVIFSTGPGRDYLVTTAGVCRGITTATTIGFTATQEQVSPVDKLIVGVSGFTDQCSIESLQELRHLGR